MSYLMLVLGVLIWAYSHLMKRVTPAFRAGLGDGAGKGMATALSLLALGLMIMGYKGADYIELWPRTSVAIHINNLLMVVAVLLIFMQANRGVMRTWLRHPMLTAVKTWALAHLLVNGSLAAIILFGGLLAWAVVDVIAINKMSPPWVRPARGPVVNDVIYVVVGLAAFAAIAWVHTRVLGYSPFMAAS